ncbi:NAD(P)H-dependent flavin oxidoreductase [Cupriavidus oxalaticus]|jgi:nitronate monooxygenase|uniref:Nitronate monooxygenase n=1 Tax=Cupriavidus oxalaticus TaxID=96344 RepID=A0A375GJI2_9BURK|nr:nitronate monooxygenase family protein [Cupriavidus oxalaticus]QRQ83439.1 nitronate monooxygenase [Cupriavidus oxalaticus]QRQ92472.1 nitronate monooxygenase [Cupriavidus oxalaticus]WQD87091.1 nitronate monooxygenase family protein [Cupriavidus oxalaticus]SPC07670.1 Nitronate monooxygenase [Cupriavidus oxalaticus]SPC24501.1 Nitronate monooxygenase [Cupriavidus oxalaticus]
MKTRLTELLGIRYPIVKGGMQWIGRARLAAAVSNAGALGMVTARTQPNPDELRREIDRTRELTDQPFGVNLTLSFAAQGVVYDDWVAAIVASGVKIVETAGNNPRPVIEAFKSAGITVIHKCTSVRHARAAERLGVDVISIDSFEAAGHIGDGDVGSMVMIPATVQAVNIPVIASGGIWGGRAMAAALVLGAEGVNVGTRFTLTQECEIHENVKQMLLQGTELDTSLIKRTLGHTARYFRNPVADEVRSMEHRPGGATYEDLAHLLAGPRGRKALDSGDVHAGLVCASQAVALIDDIPTCEELVSRMVAECRSALQASLNRFDA